MANEIYDSTWWGNTIDTASSIGTSTEMIQGQFNMLTSNQPNLVVNGDFKTDSDWTLGGLGMSIFNGKLNITNGLTYASSAKNIQEVEIGKKYLVEYKITNYVSGSSQIRLGNQFGTLRNSNGTFSEYIIANGTLVRLYPSSDNTTLSIDNVSVKEVRATTVEASKCLADAIHKIGIQNIQN